MDADERGGSGSAMMDRPADLVGWRDDLPCLTTSRGRAFTVGPETHRLERMPAMPGENGHMAGFAPPLLPTPTTVP
ncbi:hypothetical protein ACIHCV_31930 [Streptomyces sp. NPDC051956]|uniref:hypothetical protein n=1 Tax=Streptomyces sp. NPDC051956 TaxID=3365677 RepID=UPI0037D0F529